MFTGKSESEARAEIRKLVAEYAKNYHQQETVFREGDRISYAGRVYDEEEMKNLVDASLDFWLTAGRYTEEFEKKLGEFLSVPFVSLVNSGSSANLAAFMALTSDLLGERKIKRGDEVITVACGFPTTVAPILQYGAVPVFLDVTFPNCNIDIENLEKAYSEKTKAVMLAHTLGNPFDLKAVLAFCKRHSLWLIEDNCDALGSRYDAGNGFRYTGTFGDIGTSSFYPPHHMTMGEGGAVYTKDPLLHKIIRSMRDWGRDCICPPGQDNFCGHRFSKKFEFLPEGYDHKYVYSHFGYNLKATDMQAAIGVAQLEKLPGFTEKRKENHRLLKKYCEDLSEYFLLPEDEPSSDPSYFGFLLTCGPGTDRKKIVSYLESKNIQTRMLFSGNILRHPCSDGIRGTDAYRVVTDLRNTDRVMEDTFWIGVYPGMTEEKIAYMAEKLHEAVKA